MWLIRPATINDIPALLELAEALGSGMTTFPPSRPTITAKVEASVASFSGQLDHHARQYLLVLEDMASQRVIGISAVYPQIGKPFGFFSFHIDQLVQFSPSLGQERIYRTATLSNAYTGLTEVGTLAIHPGLRNSGAGRIMAKARYVLMACFPQLFADRVMAELRGWQDQDGSSPFWSATGQRFFGMDFTQADLASAVQGNNFIADLMPKLPLYLDLLPPDAINAVGRAHDVSQIAMKMLIEEGFAFEGYVDIFDAGPQLVAPLTQIRTVRETVRGQFRPHAAAIATRALVARPQLQEFRLAVTEAGLSADIALPQSTVDILGLSTGEDVVALPLAGN